jgi:hypothetical protein
VPFTTSHQNSPSTTTDPSSPPRPDTNGNLTVAGLDAENNIREDT